MELKWLEDFLALLNTRNFTSAAQLRNISQPAFSRRIQSLEAWMGTELLDRTKKQVQPSDAALQYRDEIQQVVSKLYQLRSKIQSSQTHHVSFTVAAQHSLLASPPLPTVLRELSAHIQNLELSVRSEDSEGCHSLLSRGEADLIFLYEYSQNVGHTNSSALKSFEVGNDRLIFVCSKELHRALRKQPAAPIYPLLVYPETSFLGRVIRERELGNLSSRYGTQIRCESAFAPALKEMTLAGTGMAWLPESLVIDELASGELISLSRLSKPIDLRIMGYQLTSPGNKLRHDVVTFFERRLSK
jgi:DNA-binding transcriptional LysR family regulator